MPPLSPRQELRRQKRDRVVVPQSARRSTRFAARMAGQHLPDFVALASLPDWSVDLSVRANVLRMAALLHFRQQIDRELNGARLRQIADEFGEAFFDHACTAPLPAPEALAALAEELPRPDRMIESGEALLARSLEPAIADLVQTAHALVREREA